jgi:hypothetical protein
MQLKTKADIAAAFYTILTALKVGKENPLLGGVPNGHLYAHLMNEFDLGQWTRLIAAMKDSKLLTETNHLLCITPKGEDLLAQLESIYKTAAEQKGQQPT